MQNSSTDSLFNSTDRTLTLQHLDCYTKLWSPSEVVSDSWVDVAGSSNAGFK